MMSRLIYRPDALADLDHTQAYRRRAWGEAQAKRYVRALVADIKALRLRALRYLIYDQVYPGLRRAQHDAPHLLSGIRGRRRDPEGNARPARSRAAAEARHVDLR